MPKTKKTEDVKDTVDQKAQEIPKKKRVGRPRKRVSPEDVIAEQLPLLLFQPANGDVSSHKDDMTTMEHPFFSPTQKAAMEPYEYTRGSVKIRVSPSEYGRPTQNDKDLLIYLASLYAQKKFDHPDDILRYRRVEVNLGDFLRVTKKHWSANYTVSLLQTLNRLRGSTIQTNIRSDSDTVEEIEGFSFIDGYKVLKSSQANGQKGALKVEVVLSEWYIKLIRDKSYLTVDSDYFDIKKPSEKRLYEILRKHCGRQPIFRISLEALRSKMGYESDTPLRYFKNMIKKLVTANSLPRYNIALDIKGNLLVCTPRDVDKKELDAQLYSANMVNWFYFELYRGEQKPDPKAKQGQKKKSLSDDDDIIDVVSKEK